MYVCVYICQNMLIIVGRPNLSEQRPFHHLEAAEGIVMYVKNIDIRSIGSGQWKRLMRCGRTAQFIVWPQVVFYILTESIDKRLVSRV